MNDESSPKGAPESCGSDNLRIAPPQPSSLVTADGRVWTCREWTAYLDGRLAGYLEGEAVGYDRGYAACDAEISTLQRQAARVVHAMAQLPERDPEADRAAAERREARWRPEEGAA